MVSANGSNDWRMKYQFAGKEKKLPFGVYPNISLAEARTIRDEARKVLANDKDPGEIKKAKQLAKKPSITNTFEGIALEWYNAKVSGWSKDYADYV